MRENSHINSDYTTTETTTFKSITNKQRCVHYVNNILCNSLFEMTKYKQCLIKIMFGVHKSSVRKMKYNSIITINLLSV